MGSESTTRAVVWPRLADPWPALLLFVVAVLYRTLFAGAAYLATIDTGTVQLMALRIVGGDRPLFFYGQGYMGALEAYVAALTIRMFGPSELAVCLSPILFSGAWAVVTYLLFRRLLNAHAGLWAAVCVAIPGWYTLWYSTAPYGGYSVLFFFGTLACWLAARCTQRPPSRMGLIGYGMGIGIAGAVGLWTHFLVAPYLVTAAFLIWIGRRRIGGSVVTVGLLALIGSVWLLGLMPAWLVRETHAGPDVASFSLAASQFAASARVLLGHNLPAMLFETFRSPGGWAVLGWGLHPVVLVSGGIGLVAAGFALPAAWKKHRAAVLAPAVFGACFLAMYLPHSRSLEHAPRYIIPLWSIGVAAGWALAGVTSGRRAARVVTAGFLVWVVAQVGGSWAYAKEQHQARGFKRLARAQAVAFADHAGVSTVHMVGGRIFGLHGQHLTFASGGRIRFVSSYDERDYPALPLAEADPNPGWLCQTALLDPVLAALDDLQVAYQVERGDYYSLVHHAEAPPRARRSVPAREMKIQLGDGDQAVSALLDRRMGTTLAGGVSDVLSVDLGRIRSVEGLRWAASGPEQAGLPNGYRLEIAGENGQFHTIRDVPRRIAVGYAIGPRPFLKGYHGVMEIRWDPVAARTLRLTILSAQGQSDQWQADELFVFESDKGEGTEPDLGAMQQALETAGVQFLATDRWLSAQLSVGLETPSALPMTFPPYSATYAPSWMDRRILPGSGVAVAPRADVAEECRNLLIETYGEAGVSGDYSFPPYRLLVLAPVGAATGKGVLSWTGLTLVRQSVPGQAGGDSEPSSVSAETASPVIR